MIQGIEQPEIIQIDNTLRLRKYDGVHDFALEWYMDLVCHPPNKLFPRPDTILMRSHAPHRISLAAEYHQPGLL